MLIYILYIIVISFIYYYATVRNKLQNAEYRKYFLIVAIIMLILIFALRDYSVGVDTSHYKLRYEILGPRYGGLNFDREEYGFEFLCYIFSINNVPWQIFLAIVNTFMLTVLAIFIYKYSPNPFMSIVLFMTLGLFTMYMSGMRQSLAVSICLMALMIVQTPCKKKFITGFKYAVYVFLVFVASTIHNSAFVFYPMCLLMHIRLNKKSMIIMLIAACSILLVANRLTPIIEKIIPERYEDYTILGANGKNKQNILVPIVKIVQVVFFIIFTPFSEGEKRYDKDTSLLMFMSAFTILFSVLGLSSNQVGRVAYYFENSLMVLVPRAIYMTKQSSIKSISAVVITILALIYFLISTPGGTLRIDNYLFFWQR